MGRKGNDPSWFPSSYKEAKEMLYEETDKHEWGRPLALLALMSDFNRKDIIDLKKWVKWIIPILIGLLTIWVTILRLA